VTYVEKDCVLKTYRDIPIEIKDELYIEDQQGQEKDKRKPRNILSGTPYPPININILLSHSVRLDKIAFTTNTNSRISNEPSLSKSPVSET
jgi:hypothetical protein